MQAYQYCTPSPSREHQQPGLFQGFQKVQTDFRGVSGFFEHFPACVKAPPARSARAHGLRRCRGLEPRLRRVDVHVEIVLDGVLANPEEPGLGAAAVGRDDLKSKYRKAQLLLLRSRSTVYQNLWEALWLPKDVFAQSYALFSRTPLHSCPPYALSEELSQNQCKAACRPQTPAFGPD